MVEFSKGEVSRAGKHLAARLLEVRAGERPATVDEADPADVHVRDVVEWWRMEHEAPMLAVRDSVLALARDLGAVLAVTARPKRLDTIIDKLTREPGKLASMADIGGVRTILDTQADVDGWRRGFRSSLSSGADGTGSATHAQAATARYTCT